MDLFSMDVDLLKVEPGVFSALDFAGQGLCKGGNGVLNGTVFSASGESFISKGVAAGGVITLQSLDGAINAGYEIVSVDSATQLTLSVVRADSEQLPIAIGTASGLIYRVVTFAPQAGRAMVEIAGWFGLWPGCADAAYSVEDIMDTTPLRAVSVYRVLVMIYAAMAGTEAEQKTYTLKREYYTMLYYAARSRTRVAMDANGDGVAEAIVKGCTVRLVRE
jgi:hypothetical protein